MALQLQALKLPHAGGTDSASFLIFFESRHVRIQRVSHRELMEQPARKSLAPGRRGFCPQQRFCTNTSHTKLLTAIQRAPQLEAVTYLP